ncbi:ATP-dependent protease ATPase subunit HslU [Philodulcilactobacillus myokoensis]|uniref:ATP-dependent protease ATPase subunit HslU n=1 Tax=Philodulcilactobacillus myokoensis TaxID=2929573 RepID=A0A9W6ESA8_9LACO|nr:ATP-dependent protease ATPase subunit HslU [Philodulcilactobacillus myokoensis]GLB46851.1 ATP-dependent protease ATPase subunit HslU [Philodulcilactobacillus myokoensis]
MNSMEKTPKQIVELLNQYVIGQTEAKKDVAIALRNRYRRLQLPKNIQDDITPKNMLMIGPTGVGKTEIARRLAKIVNMPFAKVEATKFTEVGHGGNDAESMVRGLVENAVQTERQLAMKNVENEAARRADNKLVKILVPIHQQGNDGKKNDMKDLMGMVKKIQKGEMPDEFANQNQEETEVPDSIKEQRMSASSQLRKGLLDNKEINIMVNDPNKDMNNYNGIMSQLNIDLSSLMPKPKVKKTVSIAEAREILTREISEELINNADVYRKAIQKAENTGIIFVDEIDKIISDHKQSDVSKDGVQRDILPIVEGCKVKTKYGLVDTSHILFIASGSFAQSKPSDMIPELQGRFPIRVKLNPLTKDDFVKILTEPDNALVKQYIALIGTDNIKVTFTIEAIKKIADIAYQLNQKLENIGARRLHTILEKLLEDLLYEGPDMEMGNITITEHYVMEKVGNLAANAKLSDYIL